ncbi:MAG: hypothetical protein HDS14_06050 [Bacteroides sp.]|nr:hypothetical protein [Bacteroides sp.]
MIHNFIFSLLGATLILLFSSCSSSRQSSKFSEDLSAESGSLASLSANSASSLSRERTTLIEFDSMIIDIPAPPDLSVTSETAPPDPLRTGAGKKSPAPRSVRIFRGRVSSAESVESRDSAQYAAATGSHARTDRRTHAEQKKPPAAPLLAITLIIPIILIAIAATVAIICRPPHNKL